MEIRRDGEDKKQREEIEIKIEKKLLEAVVF